MKKLKRVLIINKESNLQHVFENVTNFECSEHVFCFTQFFNGKEFTRFIPISELKRFDVIEELE